jgi:hypothetical protein
MSKVKVIIYLGRMASKIIRNKNGINNGLYLYGPLIIGKVQKYLVLMIHPNARETRRISNYLTRRKL